MSFDKLDKEELVRTAEEDFAFELKEDEKKSKKLILAAFAEANLKFKDYLKANPDKREQFAPQSNVLTSADVTGGTEVEEDRDPNVEVSNKPKEAPVKQQQPYVVKMTRQNPLFEIGKYRWTKDHPFSLVAPEDVNVVLREDGFVMASPSEVEEYYN